MNFLCVKHDLSTIVSNIIIASAHKMSYIKDDTHLGNSQWRIDKRVTEECVMSDRAVIKTLHTNIVHTSTLACD